MWASRAFSSLSRGKVPVPVLDRILPIYFAHKSIQIVLSLDWERGGQQMIKIIWRRRRLDRTKGKDSIQQSQVQPQLLSPVPSVFQFEMLNLEPTRKAQTRKKLKKLGKRILGPQVNLMIFTPLCILRINQLTPILTLKLSNKSNSELLLVKP